MWRHPQMQRETNCPRCDTWAETADRSAPPMLWGVPGLRILYNYSTPAMPTSPQTGHPTPARFQWKTGGNVLCKMEKIYDSLTSIGKYISRSLLKLILVQAHRHDDAEWQDESYDVARYLTEQQDICQCHISKRGLYSREEDVSPGALPRSHMQL